jgi:hypothetical protein
MQANHNTVIVGIKALQPTNINLQVTVSEQKQSVLKIPNKKYNAARAHRMASLEKEEAHKLALAPLCEEHARKIKHAFRISNEAIDTILIAEEAHLLTDRAHSSAMRDECEQHLIN